MALKNPAFSFTFYSEFKPAEAKLCNLGETERIYHLKCKMFIDLRLFWIILLSDGCWHVLENKLMINQLLIAQSTFISIIY